MNTPYEDRNQKNSKEKVVYDTLEKIGEKIEENYEMFKNHFTYVENALSSIGMRSNENYSILASMLQNIIRILERRANTEDIKEKEELETLRRLVGQISYVRFFQSPLSYGFGAMGIQNPMMGGFGGMQNDTVVGANGLQQNPMMGGFGGMQSPAMWMQQNQQQPNKNEMNSM